MMHMWAPFVFTYVIRDQLMQWQVTCPLHNDVADAPGTRCKKTLAFEGIDDRAEAARILRHWCVKGFKCDSRLCGNNSHLSKLRGRQ